MVRVNRSMRRSKSYRNKNQKRTRRTRTRSKKQIRGGSVGVSSKGHVYVKKEDNNYLITKGIKPDGKPSIIYKVIFNQSNDDCGILTEKVGDQTSDNKLIFFSTDTELRSTSDIDLSEFEQIKANFHLRSYDDKLYGILVFPNQVTDTDHYQNFLQSNGITTDVSDAFKDKFNEKFSVDLDGNKQEYYLYVPPQPYNADI